MKIRKIVAIISAAALTLTLTGCGNDPVDNLFNNPQNGQSSGTTFDPFASVTKIDAWIFSGCTNLTSGTIPDSVIRIYSMAFGGCKNIQATYKGKTYDYEHIGDLYKAINGN